MKWNVSVGLSLNIAYDDIEAETEEEAKAIARNRALEDIDFNSATLDECSGVTVYCAYPKELVQFENVDRCIACGNIIPEGRILCPSCCYD